MNPPPLPPSGLASDLLDGLPASDPTDPNRLAAFVQAVAPPAHQAVPAPDPTLHLVAFQLAGELFAFPVDRVREVVRPQALTRVPQAPEHVRGVQSLRGAILPVLEVRTRLGLPRAEVDPSTRVIVAEAGGRLLGLLVDSVLRVARVRQADVAPPPAEVRSRASEYIVGVAQLEGRTALLLALEPLLILPSPSPAEVEPR